MPEGSWKCLQCNNINYPFRIKCNRQNCSADKPSEQNECSAVKPDEDDQVCYYYLPMPLVFYIQLQLLCFAISLHQKRKHIFLDKNDNGDDSEKIYDGSVSCIDLLLCYLPVSYLF